MPQTLSQPPPEGRPPPRVRALAGGGARGGARGASARAGPAAAPRRQRAPGGSRPRRRSHPPRALTPQRPRCRLTLFACFASAVRVFFGSLAIVFFLCAAAFLMFRLAAVLCSLLAIRWCCVLVSRTATRRIDSGDCATVAHMTPLLLIAALLSAPAQAKNVSKTGIPYVEDDDKAGPPDLLAAQM